MYEDLHFNMKQFIDPVHFGTINGIVNNDIDLYYEQNIAIIVSSSRSLVYLNIKTL